MIITALLLLLVVVKAPCEHFQADLEKPILSADQPNGVYVSGELITFTCKTTNSLDSISKFLLYQDEVRLSVEPIYNPERSSATFTTQANWAGLENHNYAYTCRVHRRNVESGKSRTVWIKVIADLEKPILSADQPNGVYVSGEVITFTCKTTNSLDSISKFLLYQDEVLLSVEPIYNPERSSATFTTQAKWTGLENLNYAYTCIVHRRNVESGKSRTVWIKVIDAPEKPRLLPDRKDKVYVSDELITLNCTAANGLASISDYLLYEVIQQIPVNYHYYSRQHSSTFTIRNTTTGRKSYHCLYISEILGRKVNSEESDRDEITVVARPTQPVISTDRADQVYVSDELVTFTCWTTDRLHSDSFQLYNGGQQVNKEPVYTSQRDSATFTVANRGDAQNEYYCVYTRTVSGRVISSAQSDIIKITVVDLPSPSLSLASSYVAQEEDVTFNCTIMKKISVGTFYLYKNGVRLNDSVPWSSDAQNKSATFTIHNVDPGSSGNYTCVYKLLDGDRYLTSAPSKFVLLYVRVKSVQRWIPVLTVVNAMLMFVILGIYCGKKKESDGRMGESVPDSQSVSL